MPWWRSAARVYGALQLIKPRHGDVMMVGTFLGYEVAQQLGPGPSPSLWGRTAGVPRGHRPSPPAERIRRAQGGFAALSGPRARPDASP
jgi:hypothetical protein